ncbi:uncharacterized protein Nmag_4061 (plasmid) [Natrialba magadii ATCC 43099]|uniref:Homolog to phage PhiH1 repressor protein n=1 Tax=Natrialba magadii (strain ATCC 43099 / DSM 3394 / CCM 3739 / CIP 104546 / IAM 13178 / JCM 8861 / NBRC 102185 / NCIMB 2190 / MS3) TaxID=547559 RepID=D3T1X8_NATMM|nr:hypothetical protein [Natrialba magadii]ADD07587.1 uncharacterized protein Nmag_4061 [Natrialba magadii ATCC 43099]ELY27064.1 hypothetical protein C500_14540 [Natrialba magadii ATCC 43099]
MNDIIDPRPPLPEWILDAYDVILSQGVEPGYHGDAQSVSREQAHDILLSTDELALEAVDVDHALTRLLERGYFYEVDDELRVTTPEN